MASRKPTSNGPGRGTPRSRTVSRPSTRTTRPSRRVSAETTEQAQPATSQARVSRGIGLTQRALALLVVAAVMLLSMASSMRVYLRQESEEATARAQIAEREAAIADLTEEVERWKDPNFVKAQARERLGWVMPGEVGFRVIGPDGKPLGGGTQIQGQQALPEGEHETTWWERLNGSIAAADAPIPSGREEDSPVITAPADSSPSPTPKR